MRSGIRSPADRLLETQLLPIELLKTMGSRGGWHPDALCAASGMSFKDVLRALLDLVLTGRAIETYHGYEAVM